MAAIAVALLEIAAALWGVTKILAVAGVLYALFTPHGRKYLAPFLYSFVGGAMDTAAPLVNELSVGLAAVLKAFTDAGEAHGGKMMEQIREPMAKFAKRGFDTVTGNLSQKAPVTPDTWKDLASEAMADAFGFGLASFGVSAAFEAVFPEKLNTLNGLGPMLATLAGFEEVTLAGLRPVLKAAITEAADQDAKRRFRSTNPAEVPVSIMYSRGLISRQVAHDYMTLHGYPDTDIDRLLDAAFKPVSPFLVRGALATGALADDELRDAMRYMGMRDIDADRLVRVGQALALAPFKQKLLAEIEKAYESGNISAQQFNDDLAQLDLPDGADALVRKTTEYRKLQRLDDKYRQAVSTAYSYGLISDVDYLPAMQQFGVGEDDARAQYAVDSYRKHGREALAAAKALTQAERRLQREAIRLAEDQYLAGKIDETALTAALIAVGLGAAEAALLLGQAVTRRAGRLRLTYGLMLEPDQALELREQVGAIRAQIVKQLIDSPSALAQLKALKIPDANANALVAAWAAQAFKEVLPL